jgi:predicted RNA-binding Zn ribbon-like protein
MYVGYYHLSSINVGYFVGFEELYITIVQVIMVEMSAQNSPEPGKRQPAPGDLGLVQAFVNTVDLESGVDELRGPHSLCDWLLDRGLIDADSTLIDADFRLVIQVREALRALALANHHGESDATAVQALNRVADSARVVVRFEVGGGARLEPQLPGVDGALGRILGIVYTAMVQGTWQRLKACRRDTCRWLYYDRSKNRSSSWCAMAVCGNREKARTYRRRHPR